MSYTADNIRQEAEDRCVTLADEMRADKMVVCTVGLGADINDVFLRQVANDPTSIAFDPNSPVGIYAFASDASQMVAAFQRVAEQLSLRLVR